MKKFFQSILRYIAFPIVVILISVVPYIIADPYMDFGENENYSWKYNFQILGDLSTKKLKNSSIEYNSFIFGSSRSISLYACYLNKVIPNSSFFHFANWAETIAGVSNKLDLIDRFGYPIDNAIIYIDADVTFRGEKEISGTANYLLTNKNRSAYLIEHFKSYYKHFSLDKAKILLGLEISGEGFPNWNSDPITNDAKHHCHHSNILSDYSKVDNSDSLVAIIDSLKESGYFYKRPLEQQFNENKISNAEKEVLIKIKDILNKHSTEYYVVITPLYDQKKFSLKDQAILNEIFGERLFDFSGINSFTNNEYNFPDRVHFQPYISKYMIDSILQIKSETY